MKKTKSIGEQKIVLPANRKSPRRTLAKYLGKFAGLIKPNRELVSPSRFSNK
jgi:hypothetical protein